MAKDFSFAITNIFPLEEAALVEERLTMKEECNAHQ